MRLRELTRSMQSRGEKGLIPFLTAGYPDEETFLRLLQAAARANCPIVEIGVPFSDPIADGPAIQESSKGALEQGITLRRTLALAAQASQTSSTALVLMGYFNPFLRMGLESFADKARESGIQGVIIPDMPVEESGEAREILAERDIAFINLVARTSNPHRIERIAQIADGFLYLVSLTGVTGVRSALSKDLDDFVHRVRSRTDLPLYVGFGISSAEHARQAVRVADGVIIGSALIEIIRAAKTPDKAVAKVENFLQDIQQAINNSNSNRRPK